MIKKNRQNLGAAGNTNTKNNNLLILVFGKSQTMSVQMNEKVIHFLAMN